MEELEWIRCAQTLEEYPIFAIERNLEIGTIQVFVITQLLVNHKLSHVPTAITISCAEYHPQTRSYSQTLRLSGHSPEPTS